jgi:putative peptidoglycan lipid II flippase
MFSAHQDTKTPVKASALNLVVFLATTTLLMGALSHVAIALANSLAAAVQLAVLLYALRAKLGALGLGEVVKSVLRTTLASVAMAAVCVTLSGHVSFRDAGELVRVSSLLGIMLVGGLTFLVGARMLKAPELDELLDAVRRRRKRAT